MVDSVDFIKGICVKTRDLLLLLLCHISLRYVHMKKWTTKDM